MGRPLDGSSTVMGSQHTFILVLFLHFRFTTPGRYFSGIFSPLLAVALRWSLCPLVTHVPFVGHAVGASRTFPAQFTAYLPPFPSLCFSFFPGSQLASAPPLAFFLVRFWARTLAATLSRYTFFCLVSFLSIRTEGATSSALSFWCDSHTRVQAPCFHENLPGFSPTTAIPSVRPVFPAQELPPFLAQSHRQ